MSPKLSTNFQFSMTYWDEYPLDLKIDGNVRLVFD